MLFRNNDKVHFRLSVPGNLNKIIAHAASLMLTGVPPEVCESVITGVFCSVKRSLSSMSI
jgi:hypothetical protein